MSIQRAVRDRRLYVICRSPNWRPLTVGCRRKCWHGHKTVSRSRRGSSSLCLSALAGCVLFWSGVRFLVRRWPVKRRNSTLPLEVSHLTGSSESEGLPARRLSLKCSINYPVQCGSLFNFVITLPATTRQCRTLVPLALYSLLVRHKH